MLTLVNKKLVAKSVSGQAGLSQHQFHYVSRRPARFHIPLPNFHGLLFYRRSESKITTLKLLISLSRILIKWFCGSPKIVLQPHSTSEIYQSDIRAVYHLQTDLVRYIISTPLSTHKSFTDPVPRRLAQALWHPRTLFARIKA